MTQDCVQNMLFPIRRTEEHKIIVSFCSEDLCEECLEGKSCFGGRVEVVQYLSRGMGCFHNTKRILFITKLDSKWTASVAVDSSYHNSSFLYFPLAIFRDNLGSLLNDRCCFIFHLTCMFKTPLDSCKCQFVPWYLIPRNKLYIT